MDHSEVKHLPKVDHTPADLDDTSRRLLKAAALIETYGHAKMTVCDDGGRMCLRGALVAAQGRERNVMELDAMNMDRCSQAADLRIAYVVGGDSVGWNNAKERTAEEVISTMRRVALGL